MLRCLRCSSPSFSVRWSSSVSVDNRVNNTRHRVAIDNVAANDVISAVFLFLSPRCLISLLHDILWQHLLVHRQGSLRCGKCRSCVGPERWESFPIVTTTVTLTFNSALALSSLSTFFATLSSKVILIVVTSMLTLTLNPALALSRLSVFFAILSTKRTLVVLPTFTGSSMFPRRLAFRERRSAWLEQLHVLTAEFVVSGMRLVAVCVVVVAWMSGIDIGVRQGLSDAWQDHDRRATDCGCAGQNEQNCGPKKKRKERFAS